MLINRWIDFNAKSSGYHLHLDTISINSFILTVSLWGSCGRIETSDAETVDEYVDNDVDVDDVDDDEEGAAAYFFLVRDSDGHTNCELQECRGQAFLLYFSTIFCEPKIEPGHAPT